MAKLNELERCIVVAASRAATRGMNPHDPQDVMKMLGDPVPFGGYLHVARVLLRLRALGQLPSHQEKP